MMSKLANMENKDERFKRVRESRAHCTGAGAWESQEKEQEQEK